MFKRLYVEGNEISKNLTDGQKIAIIQNKLEYHFNDILDANVFRFAKYLKRFSSETQFIVITHRKPTMELADRLYGVTMQEKGVSKMVSVQLGEALKNVEAK